jgi:hypothetical protein
VLGESRSGAGGTAWRWTLPRRPAHDCEVLLSTDSFASVGHAALIDAKGVRRDLWHEPTPGGARWALSEPVLEGLEFPVVLDPLVSPVIPASVTVPTSYSDLRGVVATDSGWIAAGRVGRFADVQFVEIDPNGNVLRRVRGPPFELLFATDRLYLLTAAELRSGRTLDELLDGGSSPRPPFFTPTASAFTSGRSGVALTVPENLPDGGRAFTLRRTGPDLAWDGGGLFFEGAPGSLALEGETTCVGVTRSFGSQFINCIRPEGLSTLAPPRSDGGQRNGTLVSDGQSRTLEVATIPSGGRSAIFAQVLSGGAPASPELLLDDGTAEQYLTAAGWDGQVFRVFVGSPTRSVVTEYLVAPSGLVSQRVVLEDGGTFLYNRARVASVTPMGSAALLVWLRGLPDDFGLRLTTAPAGVARPLAGPIVFEAENATVASYLTRRDEVVFVGWNDTRLGGGAYEQWGRRFDLHLNPLDADAVSLTVVPASVPNEVSNFEWLTYGQVVTPTSTGFDLTRTDAYNVTLHRLDHAGRPRGVGLRVSDLVTLNVGPAVASNGPLTLVTWTRLHVGAEVLYRWYDENGPLGGERSLPATSGSPIVSPEGEFLVVTETKLFRVHPLASSELLPWAPPPGMVFSSALVHRGRLLVALRGGQGTTYAVAVMELLSDGGTQPVAAPVSELTPVAYGPSWATDDQWLYMLIRERLPDGGGDFLLARSSADGGWLPPARFQTLDVPVALVGLPDGGGVVLSNDVSRGPVVLRTVRWLPDGTPCGAPSDCESGFCVDGVCCDTACGGGAVDCLSCARASGAHAEGVCTLLGAGQTCRAARGSCDVPEVCDGLSDTCPADLLAGAGELCRPAVDACDAEERCDGVFAQCPVDLASDAGAPQCRGLRVSFAPYDAPRCNEAREIAVTIEGRPERLDLQPAPSALDVAWDGGTLRWTPRAEAAQGEVAFVTEGEVVATLALASRCPPRWLAVGCACAHVDPGTLLVLVALATARKWRRGR